MNTPQTESNFDTLYTHYCDWTDNLNEIRRRMDALRDEIRIGWTPPRDLSRSLTALNRDDERYAMLCMATARSILSAAEDDSQSSRAHRLARIERAKERIRKLEQRYDSGWRPLEGKTWPNPEVVAWCCMFGSMRFEYLDDLESIIASFEARVTSPRKKNPNQGDGRG